jgi:hypothetical protein
MRYHYLRRSLITSQQDFEGRKFAMTFSLFSLLSLVLLAPSGLTFDEFKALHAQLQPAKDEAWRTIPWKVSLIEAQAAAAREKKPIFIWAMDGHPLGCT